VLDYLVKPVDAARLAQTAARLQERLRTAKSAVNSEVLLQQLAATSSGKLLPRRCDGSALPWAQTVTLIPVQDIDFLRAEEKYTVVACMKRAARYAKQSSARPLRELAAQLDATLFAQVHRSVIVNLSSIARVVRGSNETADVHTEGPRRSTASKSKLPASVSPDVIRARR